MTERHIILLIATLIEKHLVILVATAYLGVNSSVHFLSLDRIYFLSMDKASHLHMNCIIYGLNTGLVSEDIKLSRFGSG
jgi:hypothetical protein